MLTLFHCSSILSAEKEEMDDLLQLVISVLKIADELLMDRLKEICEQVLGEQGNFKRFGFKCVSSG